MDQYFEVWAVSSPGPELTELRQKGLKTLPVPMTRKITPLADLRALWWLIRFFREQRPEIVHTHTPKAGLLGMLAAYLAGVKIRLHTVAGLPWMERKGVEKRLLMGIERLTYSLATKVYPNSQGLSEFIQSHQLCPDYKLGFIANGSSNGINIGHYSRNESISKESELIKQALQLTKAQTVFLFVGRIVRDKGIHELVEAFERVHAIHPSTSLVLVGPFEDHLDPIRDDIKRRIKQHAAILHAGFIEDIRPYLALADVFVLPTYREGFPNVLLQAGCFDLPCIATRINGCDEIIREAENGLLVEPKSVEQLTAAMLSLADNPTLRQAMGNKARQMVADRFDQQVVWKGLLNEYRKLGGFEHAN